ncbi:5-hydroxyisourate hydrolase like isoform 2 [Actinidia chinensis var. chinensis]|uniref:5-hydroxyisourate hydrolase like isoform 2 n=1 Tax=Actinidia chinensis var. chinensis TaxID=1590841 RepID=A0A2R6QPV7_ACTCC|nr:5-hydroxyisourate hydrolase like isoform 2 [Actinidia chinensis var. chinensis]
MESLVFEEKDFFACCGSVRFAKEMVSAAPFASYDDAVVAARDIWFNKVDVKGWLEAFTAHPQIGESPSSHHKSPTSAQFSLWSKGEQTTALATATDSTLQELSEWNSRYRQKFGFVFLIFASGRSTPEILAELKRRYENRPLVEFEIAAGEQMKITELRLAKLFTAKAEGSSVTNAQYPAYVSSKAGEDRVNIIGAHLTASSEAPVEKPPQIPPRTRPPITTHVLDVARGSPAAGIEVQLEMWKGNQPRPTFGETITGNWVFQGSSITDKDGRSGQLMNIVDTLKPGVYRISFNTGKYSPAGFFPYVSIVFEVRESQQWEHFHVPLLLSPFSFSTYRGS